MTQVFMPTGEVVPVTRVAAGPCYITQVKKADTNNATALQIGFGETKSYLLNKPKLGHLKDMAPVRWLREFAVEADVNANRGDVITADTFVVGDKVNVIGISKGKGFAGVVKRHHFAGGPASHGHKDNERAPGTIGAGGVQRVFKGLRMAGHMGVDQVTVKNLEIVKVDMENNELYIKGAVPGGRNGLLEIVAPGELVFRSGAQVVEAAPTVTVEPEVSVEPAVTETVVTETVVEAPETTESK